MGSASNAVREPELAFRHIVYGGGEQHDGVILASIAWHNAVEYFFDGLDRESVVLLGRDIRHGSN